MKICDTQKHHDEYPVPKAVGFSMRNRHGSGLPPQCLMTRFVRTNVSKPCPPDMSGHVPDMIADTETRVSERKMKPGRPDILAGHGVKDMFTKNLSPFSSGFGYPHVRTCPKLATLLFSSSPTPMQSSQPNRPSQIADG